MAEVITRHRMGCLLPGGQFNERYAVWLDAKGWHPKVMARAGSFLQLARLVRVEGLAAVLPESAKVEFDPAKVQGTPLPWTHERPMVLLANARSLERSGRRHGAAAVLAKTVAWETGLR